MLNYQRVCPTKITTGLYHPVALSKPWLCDDAVFKSCLSICPIAFAVVFDQTETHCQLQMSQPPAAQPQGNTIQWVSVTSPHIPMFVAYFDVSGPTN